jgi:excinuclease UvrABC nuclease subunit
MIIANMPAEEAARLGVKPSKPCQLYRHFDADGRLLYVGISLSAVWRLARHRHDAHWFHQIATVTIQTLPSRGAALVAEARAIEEEKPLHNLYRRQPQVLDWSKP